MESVVDGIPELRDQHEVGDEWKLLLAPLTNSFTLRVSEAPEALYVEPDVNQKRPISYFGLGELQDLPKEWSAKYLLLSEERERPLILLGDPGVGKSSWIARFRKHVTSQTKDELIYYDHHEQRGNPAGEHLSAPLKLKGWLMRALLARTKHAAGDLASRYPAIFSAVEDDLQQEPTRIPESLIDALRELCDTLEKRGVRVFIILDNLDLYDAQLQDAALDFSFFVCHFACVRPIVALRPATYHKRPIAGLHHKRVATVRASLEHIIRNRLSHIWKNGGNNLIQEILKRLTRVSITLSWGPVQDGSPDALKRLHIQVVEQLLRNQVLESLLQDIHNQNMREILAVLCRLVESYYFANDVIGAARRPNPEDMVTAYLRGPYKHHRGRNDNYEMRDVNIFDIPGFESEHMLIGIRILQWLSKRPDGGDQPVSAIVDEMSKFKYDRLLVASTIQNLAHKEFLLDTFRMKEWLDKKDTSLLVDDRFAVSPCGKHLLTKMLGPYAFRYLEAIADVIRIPRLDGEKWRSGKWIDDMIWNVIGVVELVHYAAESELRRIYRASADGHDRSNIALFKKTFYGADVAGSTFLYDLTNESLARATMLHTRRPETNYGAEAETEAFLRAKDTQLREQATTLMNLQLPPSRRSAS